MSTRPTSTTSGPRITPRRVDMPGKEARGRGGIACDPRACSSLLLLVSRGACTRARCSKGLTLLATAVRYRHPDCVRVLLENGGDLRSLKEREMDLVKPWMWTVQAGRAKCKAAVVAWLGCKRMRFQLMRWDRFLVREVALQTWYTRGAKEWMVSDV